MQTPRAQNLVYDHFMREFYNYETEEINTECSCGAVWTHPINRTIEERKEIEKAHIVYAAHKKMETL